MRILETRQSRTSPSKYIIELTKDQLETLFNEDPRQELKKDIIELKEKIKPIPE